MRSYTFKSYGKPASSKLELSTVPIPTPGNDQILIKVLSASINPVDYKFINGELKTLFPLTLPSSIGFDVSGIVETIGNNVKKFKKGDEVYSRVDHNRLGTMSEYVITSENSVALKPKSLNHDQAASVPLAALTALQSLRIMQISENSKTLILGASGGVGTFAVQLAKHVFNAKEITATATGDKIDKVKKLGATQMIDYKKDKFVNIIKDYDSVLDMTGETQDAFNVVKKNGIVVSLPNVPQVSALEKGGVTVSTIMSTVIHAMTAPTELAAKVKHVQYSTMWVKPSASDLTELAEWIDNKKIQPVIDQIFPFSDVKKAFDKVEQGNVMGKIVIHVADPNETKTSTAA